MSKPIIVEQLSHNVSRWIVGQQGWEYNDQIYATNNYGNTLSPGEVYVCETRQQAEELQFNLTVQHLKSDDSPQFFETYYDIEDIAYGKNIKEELNKILGLDNDFNWYKYDDAENPFIDATDEQMRKVIRIIGKDYFFVVSKSLLIPEF